VITAWIALDDVDATNGCLRYIDGSHKGPILPHLPVPGEEHNLAPSPELIDLNKESLAIVGKGGVVFHHGTTLHTSHRNESDRWRRAYATHWVTADVTSESPVLENAHFRHAG
jgi:ectoine hydroxylase-related dioxygenase (phytanoyl-CoA dioxygenase family)